MYKKNSQDYWEEPICECKYCLVDFGECQSALQDLIVALFGKNLQEEKARSMLEYLCDQFEVQFPHDKELEICKKSDLGIFEYMANYTRSYAKTISKQ